ncbi:MAG: cobalamin B12-binding domain-containing protein [Candidatus Helarchaeota archaeon]|nr:cobalamin B12-binding domain-containing protein [Candidatus Helarchaeota archaeon]
MSLEKVKELLVDLDIDEIQNAVNNALKSNNAQQILQTLCDGMFEVGRLYEEQEYYLPELMLAGETMEEAMKILRPKLSKSDILPKKGKIIAATVKGDMHDIGKNVFVTMVTAAGYDVIDLGKDIPGNIIAMKAKEENVDIVALSALLSNTVIEIKTVVKELAALGIRDNVKVICGGAPLNQDLASKMGADIACDDAVEGVRLCDKIMAKKAASKVVIKG